MPRLNDTEAIVRQGIRSGHVKLPADDWGRSHLDSADNAVQGPSSRFRRETGAGNESLSAATNFAACKE